MVGERVQATMARLLASEARLKLNTADRLRSLLGRREENEKMKQRNDTTAQSRLASVFCVLLQTKYTHTHTVHRCRPEGACPGLHLRHTHYSHDFYAASMASLSESGTRVFEIRGNAVLLLLSRSVFSLITNLFFFFFGCSSCCRRVHVREGTWLAFSPFLPKIVWCPLTKLCVCECGKWRENEAN